MAYNTKLYADNRCIAEFDLMVATQNGTYSPSQKDGYSSVTINTDHEIKKKPHNCPNCGAPITSYICEYCGTEFEKPKKKLSDEENDSHLLNLQEKLRQAELQASQEWQTQNLLNTINSYNVNTQIMNMRDSINSVIAYQTCSLHDQMYNASILTNVYPTGRIEHIPIVKDGNVEDTPVSEADEELATALTWFMIGMVIFTLFVIGVTVIYNL